MKEKDKLLKEIQEQVNGIQKEYKKKVREKTDESLVKLKKQNKTVTKVALIGAIATIFAAASSTLITQIGKKPTQQGLQTQIREVEDAMENLRNLENYLEKTKSDMIATEEAKIKIEEEYEKAKELEKLTEIQIEAISLAVNKRTKTDIIKNYFWGFVLGVSGSLFASYIRGFIKRKKEKISIGNKVEQ